MRASISLAIILRLFSSHWVKSTSAVFKGFFFFFFFWLEFWFDASPSFSRCSYPAEPFFLGLLTLLFCPSCSPSSSSSSFYTLAGSSSSSSLTPKFCIITMSSLTKMALSSSGLVNTLIKQATSSSDNSPIPIPFRPSKNPTGESNSIS